MPTLKAKVAGSWVDLIAGTDEVWVGSTAPTDPATELWVYPDGYSVNDPNIARWNSAWGIVGYVSTTTAQTGISSTVVDLTSLSVTFTPVTGRRYRTIVSCLCLTSGTGTVITNISDANNANVQQRNYSLTGSSYFHLYVEVTETGLSAAAPITRKGRVSINSSGLQTIANSQNTPFISVEDVGPVLQAVAPPVQPPSVWVVPTLLNGWTNFGAPWANFAYRLVGDKVELRGLANRPAGSIGTRVSSVMFMLPVGYRPPTNSNLIFLIMAGGTSGWGGAIGRIDILSTGEVQVMDPEGVSRPDMLVSLAGLSFSVTA